MPAESTPSKFPSNIIPKIRKTAKEIPGMLKDSRRRWFVIIPTLVIVAALAGGAYYKWIYLPAHQTTQQATLQTTRAHRGDITLSASGTGTLQPANQADLGFGTNANGVITKLDVKVGDKVEKGQVLAQLDNASEQAAYQQAQNSLDNLTSASAIAQAAEDLANAQTTLRDATIRLKYVISPGVFDSQQQVELDRQALDQAQAATGSNPTAEQQKAIDNAQAKLKEDQNKLNGDWIWYTENYVPNTFTTQYRDPTTHQSSKVVEAPTDVDIATAQANYKVAISSVQEAQWYLDALNGKDIPDDATGTNLTTFEQAKSDLATAKANLDATQIIAPFSGTVMSVDALLGNTAGSSSSSNSTSSTSSTTGSSSIITLADLSTLYLQTYVDESDYQMFKVGNQANIVFDALPDQTFTGTVVQVDPTLDTSSGSAVVSGLVKMDPTNAHLLMGMSASVDVIAGQATNAVLIPISALHEYTPGKYAVFVMQNSKLTVRDVQVGLQDLVNAEIKSGLQVGDVVSTGLTQTRSQ